MHKQPFALLQPFAGQLQTAVFCRQDNIRSDAEAARRFGCTEAAGLHQVHGSRTVPVRTAQDRTEQADGMFTDTPGLVLCIRWADCQNFVIYAPGHGVAGVLHVGWRGLVAGAIESFYATLREQCNIRPEDTYVAAGPSLCQPCARFSDPAQELPGIDPAFFDGHFVDLRGAADHAFLSLGVPADHFERHPDCTRCKPEAYWTYRGGDRDAVQAGHTNMLCCVLRPS